MLMDLDGPKRVWTKKSPMKIKTVLHVNWGRGAKKEQE